MRFRKLFISSVFIASSMSASAGSVSSMTSEQVVKGPDGSNYVQSSVNCAGSNLVPSIWRPEAGGDWCGTEVSGFCSSKKMNAAKKVCGRSYTAQLRDLPPQDSAASAPVAAPVAEQPVAAPVEAPAAAPAPAPAEPAVAPSTASSVNAGQDQLDIERERLKIEQERLELRKQQVELQKQELEIKQQMEAEKASSAAQPQQPAQPQPADSAPKKSVLGM